MHLRWFDFVVIAAYLGVLSWIGAHFLTRQKSREEYFLGGRQMHWILVGGSIIATLLSTITYLNTPGEMIRYGIGYFSNLLVVPLIIPVVTHVLIPVLKRLPITSAYEYLGKRFDANTRTLGSSVFVVRTLVWGGLIIYTVSFALVAMTGWNIYLTILTIGVFTTCYTSAGGLRTVIWTDNIQLWILFGGALAIPVIVGFSTGTGPLGWWDLFSQAGRTNLQFFRWDPTVRVTVFGTMLSYFCWSVCTQGSDQVAVQRYLSTPSLEAARKSVWVYAALKVALTLCLLVCALALFAYYARRSGLPVQAFQRQIASRADKVMPQFIAEALPTGVTGLMLAALLASSMSALSSAINSISSVFSTDILGRLLGRGERQNHLRLDKVVSFLAGVITICTAAGIAAALRRVDWNLVEVTNRVNTVMVGPMGALFFAGILFPRVGARAVLAGFSAATGVALFVAFGKEWFGLERSISFLFLVPSGLFGGLLVSYAASFVFAPPAPEKIAGLAVTALVSPQANATTPARKLP